MSRIIKMGMAASMECLSQASVQMPDAIVAGTAYGCLADTESFLTRMVEFDETLLSPTAFIQSTHNTVTAQIALQLKCHHYNNTYVHRGSSFEAAMLDAISLIEEGDARNVLVGAVDEIIEKSHAIIRRFGKYKKDGDSSSLFPSGTKGTMAGEGAAFFMLSPDNENRQAIARLEAMASFYKPNQPEEILIRNFLEDNNLSVADIDLVICGKNGDLENDAHYGHLQQSLFSDIPFAGYKNFSGEYPTSVAFAIWMAANILRHGIHKPGEEAPKRILIYNNYKLQYPAVYLLAAC